MQELAVRWGLHRTTMAAQLRKAGVELRRQGVSEEQREEAVRLYGEGWSLQRLAAGIVQDPSTLRSSARTCAPAVLQERTGRPRWKTARPRLQWS